MGVYCKNADRCSYHPSGACDLIFECVCFEADTRKVLQSTAKKTVSQEITPKEDEEQKEFAAWLDETGLLWYHTPNERRASVTELVNLTAQGMKKGVPDNFIAEPRGKYHGLYIELKRSKKSLSRKSPEQRAWIESLNEKGYKAVFAYGAEEAKRAVLEYIKGEENKVCLY